ncbi:hypothetical protein BV22DRAFT_95841 [Leucogyrophana mollusca]|uniref:Uncharacterized protein n=1 Tax=Leucogyrophana mollusca TaxID=85980 RepID=A0ACB8BY40_9AGAM|nr:hypothetical protein BV22DRAFT_95841 [Leucogyrophana mollusca]
MAPSRRTSDAAPYLTHDVTHLGRHTLIPAENNGRTRKPTKTKTKKAEREEEMRLNLGYPYRNARSGAQSTPNRGQGPSGSGRDDGGEIMSSHRLY